MSHENVVQELKKKLDESKAEIGQIQSEVKFFQDARHVHVKEEKESATAHSEPLLLSFEQTRCGSTSEEVSKSLNGVSVSISMTAQPFVSYSSTVNFEIALGAMNIFLCNYSSKEVELF